MLTRLTYASQLSPAVTGDEIDDLIAKAAASNKASHITGVLAIDGTSVCQTLEGPNEAVTLLYERICNDSRHTGVTILDKRNVPSCRFEDWGMVRGRMIEFVRMAFED